jgi:hypothetical protein
LLDNNTFIHERRAVKKLFWVGALGPGHGLIGGKMGATLFQKK